MTFSHESPMKVRGISLVEVLIVISIIGMLVSLLIPAVQSSRESARRTQCLNNSRQIGLAILQYHNASNQLPPSRIRNRFLTWAYFPLPYLEQSSVLEGTDVMGTYGGQPESFRLTPISVYLCPSRVHESLISEVRDVPGIVGDYAAITSTFVLPGDQGRFFDGAMIYGDAELREDHNGILAKWRSRTALKDITDGTSKTFLLGEASNWLSERVSIYDGDNNLGAILGNENYPEEYRDLANRHRRHPIAMSESQPNANVGSAHPKIVVFTMVDGSTHAIRKDADLELLQHLVTRAGGESTSVEDLNK